MRCKGFHFLFQKVVMGTPPASWGHCKDQIKSMQVEPFPSTEPGKKDLSTWNFPHLRARLSDKTLRLVLHIRPPHAQRNHYAAKGLYRSFRKISLDFLMPSSRKVLNTGQEPKSPLLLACRDGQKFLPPMERPSMATPMASCQGESQHSQPKIIQLCLAADALVKNMISRVQGASCGQEGRHTAQRPTDLGIPESAVRVEGWNGALWRDTQGQCLACSHPRILLLKNFKNPVMVMLLWGLKLASGHQ